MKIRRWIILSFFLYLFIALVILPFIQVICLSYAIPELIHAQQKLQKEINAMRNEIEKMEKRLNDIQSRLNAAEKELNKWSIYEATAYASLDPDAKEGMCYEGDPRITASGEPVVPGVTVAAGKELPFGTELYIHGIGKRIVQDRGAAIGRGRIDIAVKTQAEAIRFGRRHVLVKILN